MREDSVRALRAEVSEKILQPWGREFVSAQVAARNLAGSFASAGAAAGAVVGSLVGSGMMGPLVAMSTWPAYYLTLATSVGARAVPSPSVAVTPQLAPPLIALGQAPNPDRPDDFLLAIRVDVPGMELSDPVVNICQAARYEVDLRRIGPLTAAATAGPPWHRCRNRPLRLGGSVGHRGVTAGSLGCFVSSRADGRILGLSNNHVLADSNLGRVGDPILQPGRLDQGQDPNDVIGTLHDFRPLDPAGINRLDCAVSTVEDHLDYDPRDLDGRTLTGLSGIQAALDGRVYMVGRTSGPTWGRITAFDLDPHPFLFDKVGSTPLLFGGMMEIVGDQGQPFCARGDSGAVVVSESGDAVGLLFGVDETGVTRPPGVGYASLLVETLDALAVDLYL